MIYHKKLDIAQTLLEMKKIVFHLMSVIQDEEMLKLLKNIDKSINTLTLKNLLNISKLKHK